MHIVHRAIENMQWTHRGGRRTVAGMFGHAVPLFLTVASGVLYHLTIKGQSGGGSTPWAFLTAAYAVAFVLSAGAWGVLGGGAIGGGRGYAVLDPRVLLGAALLGIAAVGIEVGVLLAYRSGWAMGQLSIINSGCVAVILCLIGVLLSGESMTASRGAGLVVALGGVWLLAKP